MSNSDLSGIHLIFIQNGGYPISEKRTSTTEEEGEESSYAQTPEESKHTDTTMHNTKFNSGENNIT